MSKQMATVPRPTSAAPTTRSGPAPTRPTSTGTTASVPVIPTKGQSTLFGDTRRQDLVSPERPSRRRSSIQRVADLAGCVSVALRLEEELESSPDSVSSSSSSSSSSSHLSRDISPSSSKKRVHSIDTKNFKMMALTNDNSNGTDQGHHRQQCDTALKQAFSDDIEGSHRRGPPAAAAPGPLPKQRRRRASVDCCASADSLHDVILQSLMDETKTARTGRSKTGQQRQIKLIDSNQMLEHHRSKPRSSSWDGHISNAIGDYHDSRDSLHALMMESIQMRKEKGEDSPACKKLVDAPHFGSSQFTVCDGLVVLKSSSRRRSFSATGA